MKSKISYFIIITLVGLIFATTCFRHLNDPIRGDEAAWLFSGVYLGHLIHGDTTHPDWSNEDAIDQPPVGKYWFGIAAYLAGNKWRTLDDKTWWFRSAADLYSHEQFQTEISARVPLEALKIARIAACIAAIAAALGLLALGTIISNKITGIASCLVFASSAMVLHFVPIVEADYILIALMIWQTFFLVRWVKGKSWIDIMWVGLLLGLIIDTKLNGLIGLATISCVTIIDFFENRATIKKTALQYLLSIFFCVAVAIFLNPTFLHPIDSLFKMFDHRAIQILGVAHYAGLAGASKLVSTVFGFENIFIYYAYPIIGFITCLLSVIGIINSLRQKKDVLFWLITITALLWCGSSFWSFSQTLWLRYLLPITPFLALACGYAVYSIFKIYKSGVYSDAQKKPQEIKIGLLTAGLFLALWIGLKDFKAKEILQITTSRPSVQIVRLEFVIKKHPESIAPYVTLADLYVKAGRYKKASDAIQLAAQLQPANKMLVALSKTLGDIANRNSFSPSE